VRCTLDCKSSFHNNFMYLTYTYYYDGSQHLYKLATSVRWTQCCEKLDQPDALWVVSLLMIISGEASSYRLLWYEALGNQLCKVYDSHSRRERLENWKTQDGMGLQAKTEHVWDAFVVLSFYVTWRMPVTFEVHRLCSAWPIWNGPLNVCGT